METQLTDDHCAFQFCAKPELLLFLSDFCPVLGAGLIPVGNALCVQRTADNVVTNARQISYPSAADQNHRMLLQVMPDAGDIDGCLQTVGQSHSCNFSHCGVRLFRAGGRDFRANASFLRRRLVDGSVLQRVKALLKHRRLRLVVFASPPLSDKLVECWHTQISSFFQKFNVYIQPPGVSRVNLCCEAAADLSRLKTGTKMSLREQLHFIISLFKRFVKMQDFAQKFSPFCTNLKSFDLIVYLNLRRYSVFSRIARKKQCRKEPAVRSFRINRKNEFFFVCYHVKRLKQENRFDKLR